MQILAWTYGLLLAVSPIVQSPPPGESTMLRQPTAIAVDSQGRVYVAETTAGVIRRILPEGTSERFAGTGRVRDGLEGLAANATDLMAPAVLAVAPDDTLYFYDSGGCRLRQVTAEGRIRDVAGTGRCASAGGGGGLPGFPGGGFPGGGFPGGTTSGSIDGIATQTDLGTLSAIAFSPTGHLVFAESTAHIVRRLEDDGNLKTIAGVRMAGYSGDSSLATEATLNGPAGLAFDREGNLYIADAFNCRVRRLDAEGYITTALGASSCATSTATFRGGAGAAIERPGGLAYDSELHALFIALPRSHRVLRFALNDSSLAPFFGSGRTGVVPNEEPLSFPCNEPTVLHYSGAYGLLVVSPSSHQVFQWREGKAYTFAGRWPGVDDLVLPRGLTRRANGNLLIADAGSGRILERDAEGNVTVVAGSTWPLGFSRGDNLPATESSLDQPWRTAIRANGEIFIAEATRIRRIDANGVLRNVRTGMNRPYGLAFDAQDRLLYTEPGNHRVMRLNLATGVATTFAGGNGSNANEAGFSGDGGAATSARLNDPGDIAVDAAGNVYIADRGNHRVRRVGTDGRIATVAGNGLPFSYASVDGESTRHHGLGTLDSLAVDGAGNVYVSELERITRISSTGLLGVITGYLWQADDGTVLYRDGPLNEVDALVLTPENEVLFVERRGAHIRRLNLN
jgi:sugar lactone lactonase YvrE